MRHVQAIYFLRLGAEKQVGCLCTTLIYSTKWLSLSTVVMGWFLLKSLGIDKKFKGQSKLIFTFYSYTDYPSIKGNSCCFSLSLIIPNLSLIFSMLKKKILPLLWSLLLSGWLIICTFTKVRTLHIISLQFYTSVNSSVVILWLLPLQLIDA